MNFLDDLHDVRSAIHESFDKQNNKDEALFIKILEDLRQAGGEIAKNAALIVELVKQKLSGKPLDDRTMTLERLIALVSSLPETSYARRKVTEILVDQLWESLPHPPLSYVGSHYQYRHPDGSHNNIMFPDLGKAGTPYARNVRTQSAMNGAKPDPGLLFDLLMARGDTFEKNPAGISSVLLYHASLITHDIFFTNRTDPTVSDTSSYLDLSPLYGTSQAQQDKVRTFLNGELKPDTFSDKRLLGFPPGVNVLLVMYSRFHNYVAKTLAAINEGGRFTPPRNLAGEVALRWKDEQLFQVARLVTNGLYINISLHDYLRAIANVPSTSSTWTLDPRVEIQKILTKEQTPRGVGNQVSCEFNLLYRFHSAISHRDAEWIKDFYGEIFPKQNPGEVSLPVLLQGIAKFESSIPDDPSQRTFAGLKRKPDGRFDDSELVKILKESIEEPAGRFGANHVPEILKPVEILGIIQARNWQVGSLNEFRQFFKLKPYETFEEINPDPYVANTLRKLYEKPENVEMYPGMFLEATKPRMDPGMGLCAPYTVTRAVFSDAIALVRGDRFLTTDYTATNLTTWGINEVASDNELLGGAKMSHLILNAFPNFFKFNSVYAMQPFYTPTESHRIFDKLGTTGLYSFDLPAPESPIVPVYTHSGLKTVLGDKKIFRVPWGAKMASLESYMLASDTDAASAQRKLVSDLLYGADSSMQKFATYSQEITLRLLRRDSYELGRKGVHQVDIVKNIGNLAALHFAATLCYLPLLGSVPGTTSYTEAQLYKVLCDLTTYVFSDADPTKSWARRRESQRGTAKLCSEMEEIVRAIPKQVVAADCPASSRPAIGGWGAPKTFIGRGISSAAGIAAGRVEGLIGRGGGAGASSAASTTVAGGEKAGSLGGFGINFARRLLDTGKSVREVTEILVGTASAFVANTATAFAQVIDFYLESANASHWSEIQRLSTENTPEADRTLTKYVLEGMRLSNSLGIFRDVKLGDGETFQLKQNQQTTTVGNGSRVFVSFVATSRDPTVFPSPLEVRLDRPADSYITFGEGPHQCLGKDLTIVHILTMMKILARLKGLRRTPGDEGRLKSIDRPGGFKLYLTPDWGQLTPYPTTMKLMWDGAP